MGGLGEDFFFIPVIIHKVQLVPTSILILFLVFVLFSVSSVWGIIPSLLLSFVIAVVAIVVVVVVVVAASASATLVKPSVTVTVVAPATVAWPTAPTVGITTLRFFSVCLSFRFFSDSQNVLDILVFPTQYSGVAQILPCYLRYYLVFRGQQLDAVYAFVNDLQLFHLHNCHCRQCMHYLLLLVWLMDQHELLEQGFVRRGSQVTQRLYFAILPVVFVMHICKLVGYVSII